MKKEILIFGSSGALGNGVTDVFLTKNYDRFHLFDFKHKDVPNTNTEQIVIKDLSEEENVKEAFSHIKSANDKIFFLFSTIGGFEGGKKVWETSSEDFNRMINMNLKTNFLIAKYFSQLVSKSHSGSICLTSAYTGLKAESGKAAYGISKAAVIHLVKTLEEEGKKINLSVNAIAPLIIDTPANREWMSGSKSSDGSSEFETWIKPDEIGEFVNSVFDSYNILSGNIFQLRYRFNKN
jgi:NAD(P)-dependent dehydrogenase (short-subunit alcohol dehydrogenase family)